MKRLIFLIVIAGPLLLRGQITTPVIKARFGVDADVRANYFNGLVQAGNDDWFNQVATDTSGKYVIDTTGAAAIVAGYLVDVSPYPRRMASFYRTMSKPSFSVINNRLWLDALFVRDYHGNDTTVFTSGADKNGQSPATWSGGIQGIPDKNDILDVFIHIRRAGPSNTDSLWLFGGLSLDNITGNRYFDFEMYQTDINYDRVSHRWYGYGPDAGHTSWQFDAAGNVTSPGDIIFSAEYQSSTLTNIEARVWVQKSVWQTVTPTAFSWSGQFDGDGTGATYGYASIQPKTTGAFYTGLASATNTWPGPFRLVLQSNAIATTYAKDQFMEFSVNLSKLGLDPVVTTGGDICGRPFNRIVVKTRASSSFTAELKDFVAPTDFFLAPRVDITTMTPQICDTGSIANIYVTNPVPTSVYQWSTPNGHIVGPNTGPSIFVDTPGVYIVKQYLQLGCTVYASDTITINRIALCIPLNTNYTQLAVARNNNSALLKWTVPNNYSVEQFYIERSIDGVHFEIIGTREPYNSGNAEATFSAEDPVNILGINTIYYRISVLEKNGRYVYSNIAMLQMNVRKSVSSILFFPNPVKEDLRLELNASEDGFIKLQLVDFNGRVVMQREQNAHKGYNLLLLGDLQASPGIYEARLQMGKEYFLQKIIVTR